MCTPYSVHPVPTWHQILDPKYETHVYINEAVESDASRVIVSLNTSASLLRTFYSAFTNSRTHTPRPLTTTTTFNFIVIIIIGVHQMYLSNDARCINTANTFMHNIKSGNFITMLRYRVVRRLNVFV